MAKYQPIISFLMSKSMYSGWAGDHQIDSPTDEGNGSSKKRMKALLMGQRPPKALCKRPCLLVVTNCHNPTLPYRVIWISAQPSIRVFIQSEHHCQKLLVSYIPALGRVVYRSLKNKKKFVNQIEI